MISITKKTYISVYNTQFQISFQEKKRRDRKREGKLTQRSELANHNEAGLTATTHAFPSKRGVGRAEGAGPGAAEPLPPPPRHEFCPLAVTVGRTPLGVTAWR